MTKVVGVDIFSIFSDRQKTLREFSMLSRAVSMTSSFRGAGGAQKLERQTRDRKVAGSSPDRRGRRYSSPGSIIFCADYYFSIRSTPV